MSAKKFKIQIGITRRMLKEVKAYEKEVITNTNKIAKMREDGKDEYGKYNLYILFILHIRIIFLLIIPSFFSFLIKFFF